MLLNGKKTRKIRSNRFTQTDCRRTHIYIYSPKTNTTTMRIIYQSQSISRKMRSAHMSNIIIDWNIFDIFDLSIESVLWIQFQRLNNLFNKKRDEWWIIKKTDSNWFQLPVIWSKNDWAKGRDHHSFLSSRLTFFFPFSANHIYVPFFYFHFEKVNNVTISASFDIPQE